MVPEPVMLLLVVSKVHKAMVSAKELREIVVRNDNTTRNFFIIQISERTFSFVPREISKTGAKQFLSVQTLLKKGVWSWRSAKKIKGGVIIFSNCGKTGKKKSRTNPALVF